MAEESQGIQGSESEKAEQSRSAADNIRELTAASKQLLQAGKQMTDNLSELSERVEHASTMGAQILKSPWLIVAGALIAGTVMLVVARKS